jgi:tetratricopeptide (TPR) repeat protein
LVVVAVLAVAGWSCSGVSEEARTQSAADVENGLGYLQEHDAQGRSNVAAAVIAWERAIRLDPENADAHRYLGVQLLLQGNLARAEQLLRRALVLYERRAAEDERLRSPLAEVRNTLGVVLMNTGRTDEALPLFRAASDEITYTTPHLAYGNLGWALNRKGRYREAVTALERSVSAQPRFCLGWARLGESFNHLNEYDHALEALNHALDASQEGCDRNQGAFLERARAHIQLHQTDQARDDLRRCVELDSTTAEGRECADVGRSVAP